MLATALKRKLSQLHPAPAEQASSSDDEDPVGALGAYDRLLELTGGHVKPAPARLSAYEAHVEADPSPTSPGTATISIYLA